MSNIASLGVKFGADTSAFARAVSSVDRQISALSSRVGKLSGAITLKADVGAAAKAISQVQGQLSKVGGKDISIGANTSGATNAIGKVAGAVDSLGGREIPLNADPTGALNGVGQAQGAIDGLHGAEVPLSIDTSGLDVAAGDVENRTNGMAVAAGSSFGRLGGFASKAFAIIGTGAAGLGGYGLSLASENEQASISFTTLLGSADKAQAYIGQLKTFAAKTPFDFPGLRDAASRFLAVGTASNRVIPIMRALGDSTSAMGTGAMGIDRATTALTQMAQKGKVTGEEMLQLAEAGVPAWGALAQQMGVSIPEAQKKVSAGQVQVNTLMDAISGYAGPLQKVKGMMDAQSKSLSGLWSTLKDTFGQGLSAMLGPAVQSIKGLLPSVTKALSGAMTEAGPAIGSVVKSLGEGFKAVLPVVAPLTGMIADLARVFVQSFAPIMPQVASGLKGLASAMRPVIDFMGQHPAILQTAAALMVANKAVGGGIEKWGSLASSVSKAGGPLKAVIDKVPLLKGGQAAFDGLAKGAKGAAGAIGSGASALGRWIASSAVATASAARQAAAFVASKVATFAAATAEKAAAAAQWLLNAAMSANPIMLVVLAIAALVGGLILAYTKVGWFRDFVNAAFNLIKNVAVGVFNWLKDNWMLIVGILTAPFGGAVLLVIRYWDQIKGAALAAFNWLKTNWPLVLAIITGPIGLAVLWVINHWNMISGAFSAVVGAIANGVGAVVGFIASIPGRIAGFVGGIFRGVSDAASGAKDWVVARFNDLVGFITGLPGRIGRAAAGMFNGISDAFRATLNWVIDRWNGLEFKLPTVDTHIPGVGKIGGWTLGTPNIPRLAAGGVATTSTVANIGEAGQEAVLPLTNPAAMDAIASALVAAMRRVLGVTGPTAGAPVGTAPAGAAAPAVGDDVQAMADQHTAAFTQAGAALATYTAALDATGAHATLFFAAQQGALAGFAAQQAAAWQLLDAQVVAIDTQARAVLSVGRAVFYAQQTAAFAAFTAGHLAGWRMLAASVAVITAGMLGQVNTVMTAMIAAGMRGGSGTSSGLQSTLFAGVGPVQGITRAFARAIADALSAILKGIGKPPIVLGFARGGTVPGVGTHDSVPAMLTPKEHVLTRHEASKPGVFTPGVGVQHFAGGGPVLDYKAAMGVAQGYAGTPYVMGPADCSMAQSLVYAALLGLPPNRYFTTVPFLSDAAKKLGFVRGPSKGWMLGSEGGGGASGHMASTLLGTNFEQTPPAARIGPSARGALDPLFGGNVWHLAQDAGADIMVVPAPIKMPEPQHMPPPGGQWLGGTAFAASAYVKDIAQKWTDEHTLVVSPVTGGDPGIPYAGGPIGSPAQWAGALLGALGIAPSPGAVAGLTQWAAREGGHWHNTAHYNPLNTTKRMPGSHSMNSIGVQAYVDWAQGIAATVATLRNGHYGGILAALANGGAGLGGAVGASPWGTPAFGGGGIVKRRPGGLLGLMGEGRHDEMVMPLPRGWQSMVRDDPSPPPERVREGPLIGHVEIHEDADADRLMRTAVFAATSRGL